MKAGSIYLVILLSLLACSKDKQPGVVEKKCVLALQPGPSGSRHALISSAFKSDTVSEPYLISFYGSWRGQEGILKSMLKFDLEYISDEAEVDSAFLYLYNDPAYMIQRWDQAQLVRIRDPWDSSVTWNSQPSVDEASKIDLPASAVVKDYRVNVIDNVQYWVKNKALNHGMMMSISPEVHNNALVFASGSHPNQNLRPKLEVYYRMPANKKCNCKPEEIPVPQPDSIIVEDSVELRPDPISGIDAYISSVDPDLPGGSQMQFSCGSGEFRSLIRFDFSSLQNVVEVKSAVLSLSFYYNGKDTICDEAELLPLLSAWNPAVVTWNNQPATSIVGKVSIPAASPRSGAAVDLTTLAAGWILLPQTNYGMMLRIKDSSAIHTRIFCSSNYTDPLKRPKIVVKYRHKVSFGKLSSIRN